MAELEKLGEDNLDNLDNLQNISQNNSKKMEQKCTICYENMNTSDYIGKQDFDCVDVDDTTCLRIKCGHAFHTNCIMQAFRGNLKCPICRDSLTSGSSIPNEFFVEFYDNQNGEENEEEEEDDTFHPDRLRLETEVKLERCKNKEIIEKRKTLKKKIKEFHLFHSSLKKNRRDLIKQTLQNFRKTSHKKFNVFIKNVQTDVNEILFMEKKIVEKKLNEKNVSLDLPIVDSFFHKTNPLYNVYDILQKNGEDVNINGFQKKFWTG